MGTICGVFYSFAEYNNIINVCGTYLADSY